MSASLPPEPGHLRVSGPTRPARARAIRAAGVSTPDVAVDCHRGARGPYTGAGSLLRALIPAVHADGTIALDAHVGAILCAAPELSDLLGGARDTLTSLAPPEERTRWYPPRRTRRISNSLVEFLDAYGRSVAGGITLVFDTVHHADVTDREFLSIAVRRLDPRIVRFVIGDDGDPDPDRDGGLSATTAEHAHHITAAEIAEATEAAEATETAAAADTSTAAGGEDLARAYVAEDGTGDDPVTRAAYAGLDAGTRDRLHRERAEALEARGEFSLRLGAIPYHRRHGHDPRDAWPSYAEVESYCMGMGFYHAVLESLDRLDELSTLDGMRRADFQQHAGLRRGQIMGMLERPEDSERIYLATLALTRVPRQVMSLHYALGMLYTRWQHPSRKNHDIATAFLNTAVAIATQLDVPADRAFYTAFMSNGLALARMHADDLTGAFELVEAALALLDRDLVTDKHLLHRSVLRHNHAQLLAALGRRDEALAELDEVIELDPHYPDYWFDRANLRFKTGDHRGALADYDRTAELGPPFPELFHNRAEVYAAVGDAGTAIRLFGHALELEPDNLEARISLASLLLDQDTDTAATVAELIEDGLRHHPAQPRMLCLLGRARAALGDADGARTALDLALSADGTLHQALVARAVLSYEQERYADALADLDAAVTLAGDDPDLFYNRGFAHEAIGDPAAAAADYGRALSLGSEDTDELTERRDRCLELIGAAPAP